MANEKRLIDANALWCDVMMLPHNGDMISSEEVEQAIKDAPTVDAVEVVRCKSCRQSEKWGGQLFCRRWGADWHAVNENAFCSYGERKDND